jgi:hypothetical protein
MYTTTIRAFYVTGPFVAMINYMLMRDAKQFSLIYLIFLCSFAQSIFFTNYKDNSADKLTTLTTAAVAASQQQRPAAAIDKNQQATRQQDNEQQHELELLASWLVSILAEYAQLWLELFKMTLGVYELQPFRHSLLSRALLMLFLHLIPILFNM